MTTAIDLFAGLGGWSAGAKMAGVDVLWAANHWPSAVEWHSANHPGAIHVCQDLHQAKWADVPAHDVLLASPCCQGHSKARGKASGNAQHDESRSTAWAVIAALEFHKSEFAIVENVPEFLDWALYPAWEMALHALGYKAASHIVDCADLGVPQNRIRLFIVLSRSESPLFLNLPKLEHKSALSFLNISAGRWSNIDKPNRAAATLERIEAGRKAFGDQFLISYYGNTKTGRSIGRPIGTITTRDRWAIINGDKMRILSADENLLAQSFPANTLRPNSHKLTVHLAGNAVPPQAAEIILKTLLRAA